MPKKFWQFRNQAAGSAELLLYGDISDSSWWGDEVTPKTFADELNALGALTSLTVRINSGGGDVLDRDFGIDINTTDYPQESAQALLAAEYVRKTKMYEPRARVVRVEWTDSKAHDGNMTPKVVIDLV